MRASPQIFTNSQAIRDDMSQSPKAIKATDKRVDYLFKAKQARMEKKAMVSTRRQNSLGDSKDIDRFI